MKVNNKPVLLVEDDQVDAMSVTRAFNEIQVTNQLVHVENGEEALDYLRGQTMISRASFCLT